MEAARPRRTPSTQSTRLLCEEITNLRFQFVDTVEQRERDGHALCIELEVISQPMRRACGDDALRAERGARRPRIVWRDDTVIDQLQQFVLRPACQLSKLGERYGAVLFQEQYLGYLQSHCSPPLLKRARGSKLELRASCSYSARSPSPIRVGTTSCATA